MKKNYDEMLADLRGIIGERNDDEALTFVENFADSFSVANETESEDWKQKYEDNDREWRERYRTRFFEESSDTKPAEKSVDEIKIEDIKWRDE